MSLTERARIGGVAGVRLKPAAKLLLPVMLFMLAFFIVPFAGMIDLSFYKHSAQTLWTNERTLGNYRQVLDSYYFGVFIRSVRMALETTACTVVLGYPVAYFLARCSPRTLSAALLLLVAPLMVSTVIRAFGWQVILGNNGLIDQLFGVVGLGRLGVIYTETAVVIALVQLVLPLMVLPMMASIEAIPIEIEEAAFNLGASRWGVFSKVVLPLSLPGLASGAILAFAVSISVVVTPALLGGRKARMIGNEIYDQVLTGLNWPFASAMAILMIVGIFAVMAVPVLFGIWRRRKPDHA